MGKGMWECRERARDGAAQSAPGPPCCVHSDAVSSCLGEGKQIRGHLCDQTRNLLSPGEVRTPVQTRANGSFPPVGFLNHGPRDSLLCGRKEGPHLGPAESLSSKKRPHSLAIMWSQG